MNDVFKDSRDNDSAEVLVEIPPGRYLMAEKTAFLKIEEPIIQLPRVKIHSPEILIGIKALIAGPIGTLMRVGKGLLVNFRRHNVFLD